MKKVSCSDRDNIIRSFIADAYANTADALRLSSHLRTASKLAGVAVALFVALHLIPRLLFSAYGVIWGTIIPVIFGVIAAGTVLYAIGITARGGLRAIRTSRAFGRFLSRPIYCPVCGKELPMTQERLQDLLTEQSGKQSEDSSRSYQHQMFWKMPLTTAIVCSDQCQQEVEKDDFSPEICWRCGRNKSECGYMRSAGLCSFDF